MRNSLYFDIIKIGMLATEKNNDVIEQIKKLMSRIDSMQEIKMKYLNYGLEMEGMFADHSKNIKTHIDQFEGIIINKSFYSIAKCQNIKNFISNFKNLCLLIQNFAKMNIDELRKLDTNTSKLEGKIKSKSQSFIRMINEYNTGELDYNRAYAEYEYQCLKLNEMMNKYKSETNPINFYNLKTTSDDLKKLDKKYNDSEYKQASLYSSLQYLDQKRKVISENIKDIKDDYVILLHTHMTSIQAATTCLADVSKDQMQNLPLNLKNKEAEGDSFIQRIQRFDEKYGKGPANDEFSDLKDLFLEKNQDEEITTDQRLFFDRCETFFQKKSESVEEFLQIQRKLIDQIHLQIQNCEKVQKEAISVQKSIFKSNGADDFKKNIRKYFGQGTLNLLELSFIIIDVPKKRLGKISAKLQSYDEKLKKSVQKKEDEYKKFKKKISQLLSEHNIAAKSVHTNTISVSQFKANVEKTFTFFKNIYDSFIKQEAELDKSFNYAVSEINTFVVSQIKSSLIQYTLNKQKEKFLYNLLKNFNSDTEIIEIVKEDTRYEILFNDIMKPVLASNFKPKIDQKRYEETKKILQKKETQLRGIIGGDQEIGCCGRRGGRVEKYSVIKTHDVKLVCENNSREGRLSILNKGLKFEEKRKNPFGEKIEIIIKTKQIISFANSNMDGVEILTSMGPILFLSERFQEIGDDIEKNIGSKLATKEHNQSKLDRSNDSSFFKQNNTSTEYKVSFERIVTGPEIKSNLKNTKPSNHEGNYMKKFMESWKKAKLFMESFVVLHFQETTNSTRVDYKFQDDINKFLLREKRSVKSVSSTNNSLQLHYQWKVSFPDMPMLQSFVHGQEVKIDILADCVKINITEANRGESHLYIRKSFYSEITAMNEKLVNLIVEVCEREAHVIKSEEPENEESTIILDLENLGLDKEEVIKQKRLSTTSHIQSEKGEFKDPKPVDSK